MTPEARKALEASIAHWEKNVAAKDAKQVKTGPQDCALCLIFRPNLCDGCPVFTFTRRRSCHGSPYIAVGAVLDAWEDGLDCGERFREAAQAELDFLRSLLPAKEEAA